MYSSMYTYKCICVCVYIRILVHSNTPGDTGPRLAIGSGTHRIFGSLG